VRALTEAIYTPVLNLIADHKIRSMAQIEQALKDSGMTFAQLIQVVLVLCGNDITFLASPVTGGGVVVGRFHQLFVLAMQQGKKKPEDWAAFVSQILTSQAANATCFFMLRRTGNAFGLDNLTTGDIPAVDAMFIRVSNEKRSILPRIRSEMRG
jgi:hypothetical protein